MLRDLTHSTNLRPTFVNLFVSFAVKEDQLVMHVASRPLADLTYNKTRKHREEPLTDSCAIYTNN